MKRVKIIKEDLKTIFEALAQRYRTIGPKLVHGTVVMAESSFEDIPAGYEDRQGPGSYRLEKKETEEIFSFSPGADSFKKYLCPSSVTSFSFQKSAKGFVVDVPEREGMPLAFIGSRACDLAALSLLDQVFLDGPVRDQGYEGRRKSIFIVSVNCNHPSENCFCDAMGTGPYAKEGFDL